MSIDDLKKIFRAGGLKKAIVSGCLEEWFLTIETMDGQKIQVTNRQTHAVRAFVTVETALKAAFKIGFDDAKIEKMKDGKWSQR